MHGHAVECRVYAEDPAHEFLPSTGQIRFLRIPHEQHIRIDTGIEERSTISIYYDPMIAKIIAWGETRADATQRLISALQHYHVGGVKTNRSYLLGILQHPQFAANTYTTHFLNENNITAPQANLSSALAFAAAIDYAALSQALDPIYLASFGWQMHLSTGWTWYYRYQEETFTVKISPISKQKMYITFLDSNPSMSEFEIHCTQDTITLDNGHERRQCYYDQVGDTHTLYLEQEPIALQRITSHQSQASISSKAELTAPMPGTVVAVLKQLGEQVESGEALIVLEAMKMEHTIRAPHAGKVQDIFYPVGSQVQEGATLAAVEPL